MADAFLISAPDDADSAALSSLKVAAQAIATVLGTARRLLTEGHRVDLSGIDDFAGRICAKALDLPPSLGRQAVPALTALQVEVDALTAALTATTKTSPHGKRPAPCTRTPSPTPPR